MIPASRLLPLLAAAALLLGAGASEVAMELALSSPAFGHGKPIPSRFTADGSDLSPPLVIAHPPQGTVSFALIADDPDAPMGTWVHWVAWNLPGDTTTIDEGALPAGAVEGRNSWRRSGYGGPSPPSGTHRYFFKLYALDANLDLPATTDKSGLERATVGHVLAATSLMGTYSRDR